MTGLPSLDSRFSEFGDLPERFELSSLVAGGADFVMLGNAAAGPALRGIGFRCLAGSGPNDVLVTIASPAVDREGFAYLVLYAAGREIGEVALVASRDREGSQEAVVALDQDEVGLYRALLFYTAIDAVLLDENAAALDHLRLSTDGFAAAIEALPCW